MSSFFNKIPRGSVALLVLLLVAGGLVPLRAARAAGDQPTFSNTIELTTLAPAGLSEALLDSQGHFQLLYTTSAPQSVNLLYKVVSGDSHDVKALRGPITLASRVDNVASPTLALDSRGRLHAAWIETYKGLKTVRHAVLEDPTTPGAAGDPQVTALYQGDHSITYLSGGADAQGNVFYAWLDTASGKPQLAMAEVRADLTMGQRIQLTHLTIDRVFPHLAVYPDSTLAAVFLQQNPQAGWNLVIAPFDASGKSLHDPTIVATQLHPGPLNVAGRDPSIFHFDPLAIALDAQGVLHVGWGAVLRLGYARATRQPDYSFAVQPTLLSQNTYNYQQLCFSAGPNRPPQAAPASQAAPLWLSWLDDTQATTTTALFPYIAQIAPDETLRTAPTALVGRDINAANPCPQQDARGGLYVVWQQFDDNGNYALMMKTTTLPQSNPFWVQLGLNRNQPIQQIIYIMLGSILFGVIALLANFFALPVAALVFRFGKNWHIPHLALLLIGFGLLIGVDIWFQSFMASNFQIATPPYAWAIVGSAVALLVILFQWHRSRRYPPETLGAIGQLLLSSYIAAIILSVPLIYAFTQHLT